MILNNLQTEPSKLTAEFLRADIDTKKKILENEFQTAEIERKAQLYRLEEIHRQVKKLKIPRNTSSSKVSSYTSQTQYLEQLKELQFRAKEMLYDHNYLVPVPKLLNEENLKKTIPNKAPLKIPVLVPQSLLQKSAKIQPPCIQKVLKSGEICNVYLLSDNIPAYDPLVKAEMTVNRDEINKKTNFIGEIASNDVKR